MEKGNMTVGDWRDSEFNSCTAVFSYVDGDYTSEDVLLDAHKHAISVYTDTHVLGPNLLAVRGKLRLFAPWLKDLFDALPPRKQRDAEASSKKVKPVAFHETHASHHTPASSSTSPAVLALASPASTASSSDVTSIIADVTAEAQATSDKVWEEIEAARKTYTTVDGSMETFFRDSLLGGVWQVERGGQSIYGWRCDVKQGTTLHMSYVLRAVWSS
eukprot:2149709-Amphidinium_carterae.1